jgi:hypothetical protein
MRESKRNASEMGEGHRKAIGNLYFEKFPIGATNIFYGFTADNGLRTIEG